MRPTTEPRELTLAEWRTRAREAEALAWRRYKTIKKLRAKLRAIETAVKKREKR